MFVNDEMISASKELAPLDHQAQYFGYYFILISPSALWLGTGVNSYSRNSWWWNDHKKQCWFELWIDVVIFSPLTNAIYICNIQYVRIIVFCDLPALVIIGLLNHHSSCEVKMTSNCYFNLHSFHSEKENCSILQSLVYLFLCELSGLFLWRPMLSSLRKHFYILIITWLLYYTWGHHISFSLSFLTKVFCHADIKHFYFCIY